MVYSVGTLGAASASALIVMIGWHLFLLYSLLQSLSLVQDSMHRRIFIVVTLRIRAAILGGGSEQLIVLYGIEYFWLIGQVLYRTQRRKHGRDLTGVGEAML